MGLGDAHFRPRDAEGDGRVPLQGDIGQPLCDRVIADAAARGLTDVSLERDTPVAFGVTGPGMSQAEAEERIAYGATAVESAISLAEELQP